MDAASRRALRTIRQCIGSGRVRLLMHFRQRMAQRGIVWPDLLAIFDQPVSVRADGADEWGRARWIVSGHAADGQPLDVVCVLDRISEGESAGREDEGALTVLITIYSKG